MIPLSAQSRVVDAKQRWSPDWYSWISQLAASVGGGWQNTATNATVADYTVVDSDDGATLALGGSVCSTLTFGPPPDSFLCFVQNTDPDRAKKINFNGLLKFLWPLQGGFVFSLSGLWYDTFPARWYANGGATFFVDSGGNDANDGLAETPAGALKNMQTAVDRIHQLVDTNNMGGVVKVADGIYDLGDQGVEIDYTQFQAAINIIGNLDNPGAVQVLIGNGVAFASQEPTTVGLAGMTVSSYGTGSTGVYVRQFATCDLQSINFGQFPAGVHVSLTDFASVNITEGDYAINGGASAHIGATLHSSLQFPATITCTVAAGLQFDQFIILSDETVAELGGSYSGPGADGATLGQKWILSNLSVLNLNGTVIPGNVAGTPAVGASLTRAGLVNA